MRSQLFTTPSNLLFSPRSCSKTLILLTFLHWILRAPDNRQGKQVVEAEMPKFPNRTRRDPWHIGNIKGVSSEDRCLTLSLSHHHPHHHYNDP